MVLVLWDFLAIIPLSTDKLVSHGKLFLFTTGFPVYFFSFCCPFTI